MSKSSSGHFFGTIGQRKQAKEAIKTKHTNNATQNHRHVVAWAEVIAKGLSKKERRKFNTAAVVFDERTGKYYYGRNGGIMLTKAKKNAILFGDSKHIGIIPSRSLNKYPLGNCAEVEAINNALNDNAKLSDLHITTIHSTKNKFGKRKRACQNCTVAFKGKIKRNYTGWFKKEEED